MSGGGQDYYSKDHYYSCRGGRTTIVKTTTIHVGGGGAGLLYKDHYYSCRGGGGGELSHK